ncbi:MAG: tyrosine-type recombinase/integrase [Roseovarius sp.]
MRKKLTDRFLEGIKPPASGRDTYSDTSRPGLHLRVGQRKATWTYEKRVKGGPKRKHTLGTYCLWTNDWKRIDGTITLAEARRAALELESEAMRGVDRVAENRRARIEAERAAATRQTVEQVVKLYADLKLATLKTGKEVERELRKSLAGHLLAPMGDLTRSDLQPAIDAHAAAGRIVYANRTRAYLRAFTGWAARRDYLKEDIGAALEGAGREMPRDRVLSLDEVRAIFKATYELGPLFGPLFRLLILTGQRRGEISNLRWANVSFDRRCIELQGGQTKNRRPHVTHLSEPALQELRDLHESRGRSEFIFTTTGETPTSGISKAKRRLDALLSEELEHWRLHDLRRAMATALASAGVPEGVVDRIQNHAASGSAPSAVARVYQQSDLLPQRAAALDRWAEMVTSNSQKIFRIG